MPSYCSLDTPFAECHAHCDDVPKVRGNASHARNYFGHFMPWARELDGVQGWEWCVRRRFPRARRAAPRAFRGPRR